MRSLLIVSAILFFTSIENVGAQEAHKYQYVTANDSTAVFMDVSSIQTTTTPSQVIAWTIWVYYPEKNIGGGLTAYSLSRDYYDCASQQSATSYDIDYDIKGNVVYSNQPYVQLKPVVPDSMGEVALKAACGGWQSLTTVPYSTVGDAVAIARQVLKSMAAPPHKPQSK